MKRFSYVVLALAFFACGNEVAYYSHIEGEWICSSWTAGNNQVDKCNNNVYFQFNEDRSYKSTLGAEKAEGTYRIEGKKLYATPIDKMVIGVKILQLDKDTMVFLMNNGGVEETLGLIRKL